MHFKYETLRGSGNLKYDSAKNAGDRPMKLLPLGSTEVKQIASCHRSKTTRIHNAEKLSNFESAFQDIFFASLSIVFVHFASKQANLPQK